MACCRIHRRGVRLCLAAVLAVLAVWACWPRKADIRRFDPVLLAEGEARMWRHYYEPDHLRLAADIYGVTRRSFGFSPLQTARMAWHAGRAASLFHGNGDPERHRLAETHLLNYYRLLADAAEGIDTAEAARLEIQWWREHRVRDYEACVQTLARLNALIYGGDSAAYQISARRRVEAMRLCDERTRTAWVEEEWQAITAELEAAYAELHEAIRG